MIIAAADMNPTSTVGEIKFTTRDMPVMPRVNTVSPEQRQSKTAKRGSDLDSDTIGCQFSGRTQYWAVNKDISDWGPTDKSLEVPKNV